MSDAAATFRHLHRGPDVLLLANCWDAGSARLLESLGCRAVATTSAGVAWAHGYPDGDAVPVERLVATVGAIARVIGVPLTVDVEGGYSDDPATVGETIAAVVDAGAVGVNIEDGSGTPELLAAKIACAKEAAARRGVDLFVNARTDVYLRDLVPGSARVPETLARAARYRDAGADGLFVPKVVAPGDIREIASAAGLPLNVLAWPGLPPARELGALGVRRLSAGSAIAQNAWGRAAAVARAFLDRGRSEPLAENAMPYPEINALFGLSGMADPA
jgi:2-methylisocitrate lyase-like PEP mutase family enzyme